MNPRKVTDNVFFVGTPDWDRRLFDALIPLPQGTSYNAYLITGKKKLPSSILWIPQSGTF